MNGIKEFGKSEFQHFYFLFIKNMNYIELNSVEQSCVLDFFLTWQKKRVGFQKPVFLLKQVLKRSFYD